MGLSVAAMMLDIDYFKKYNDKLGHLEGDQRLRELGEIIGSYAGELGLLAARYGGEEFALLLADCPPEEARRSGEDLLARIAARKIPGPEEGAVLTVSLGVAVQLPRPGDSLEKLLSAADQALYRSKEEGRDRMTLLEMDQT